jgi:hypothetical protein
MRQDESRPYQTVPIFAAGKRHDLRVKVVPRVLWRAAGLGQTLQLLVVAPLGYRLSARRKVLYRQPAYVLCTDPDLPVAQVLQEYVWRGEIEVNFRGEKALLGVGEAQVRHPASVQNVPACGVAAHGLLLLAGAQAYGTGGQPDSLPQPRWPGHAPPPRATTNGLIRQLRLEAWGRTLDVNFCDFATRGHRAHKPQKTLNPTASAVLFPIRA